MTYDATHWDARYEAADRPWSATPSTTVEVALGDLPPGRALDVAAGDGRHAVWLARRGWRVTAVDFSTVGVERGRANAADVGDAVDWVVADVTEWSPPPGTTYDLVLFAYLHMPTDVIARYRDLLAPGGRLVVVGHALRNRTDGTGGPREIRFLHTEEQHRAAAGPLTVERLGEVFRETPEGTAIDLCLVARRPT